MNYKAAGLLVCVMMPTAMTTLEDLSTLSASLLVTWRDSSTSLIRTGEAQYLPGAPWARFTSDLASSLQLNMDKPCAEVGRKFWLSLSPRPLSSARVALCFIPLHTSVSCVCRSLLLVAL